MSSYPKDDLFNIGLALVVLGVAVKVALAIGLVLNHFVIWAFIVGGVLMIVGAAKSKRK